MQIPGLRITNTNIININKIQKVHKVSKCCENCEFNCQFYSEYCRNCQGLKMIGGGK